MTLASSSSLNFEITYIKSALNLEVTVAASRKKNATSINYWLVFRVLSGIDADRFTDGERRKWALG